MACASVAMAQTPDPDFGSRSPNPVRIQASLPNRTGQDANDFHADVSSKDSQGIRGAGVDAGIFPVQNVARTGPSSFSIDLSGATVPNMGSMPIDIVAWLAQMNQLTFDWYWTRDGVRIGGRPGFDFNVDGPMVGGGGGIPPRQGGGGGAGNFIHSFTLMNSGDKPLEVLGVSYFASMDFVDNMDTLPWFDIPPVLLDKITLLPQEAWSFDFETTGSYAGGNIYFKLIIDDPISVYGAHPVLVPEPETWAMLAGVGLAGFATARRWRAGRSVREQH
jgi:hypothetical protein